MKTGRGNAAPGRSGIRTSARREAWQQTCEVCPGSGKGNLVPLEKVLEQAAVFRL